MAIKVTQISDKSDFGDDGSSFLVPMGYFSVLKTDHATVKYLKSSGFASCIGLVLYSAESTLLAHFQSANFTVAGVKATAEAFGKAGVLDYSLYEGFLLLGSNVNAVAMSKTDEMSQANTRKGLTRVKTAFSKKDAKFLQTEQERGFQCVAVSIANGEVRLFNETPKAKTTPATKLDPDPGAPLVNIQPD